MSQAQVTPQLNNGQRAPGPSNPNNNEPGKERHQLADVEAAEGSRANLAMPERLGYPGDAPLPQAPTRRYVDHMRALDSWLDKYFTGKDWASHSIRKGKRASKRSGSGGGAGRGGRKGKGS